MTNEFDELRSLLNLLGGGMRETVSDRFRKDNPELSNAVSDYAKAMLEDVTKTGQIDRALMLQKATPSVVILMNSERALGANAPADKYGPSPACIQMAIAKWLYEHPEVEAEIQNDLSDTVYGEYYFTPEGGNKPGLGLGL